MTNSPLFEVCPLASGSKGNSLFIGCCSQGILVDAGLSGIEIERRLAARDINPERLTAVVITHEHTDHVKGAGILSRRFNIPVFITPKTYEACSGLGKIDDLRFFDPGESFEIREVKITPFSTSHDAADPVGLTLEYKGLKIGVATDLGIATSLVKERLRDSDLLYLESNHDLAMLLNGPYPWHLKQRIKDRKGHLSNTDAGNLLKELKTDRLRHVILAHLSEENNCPKIAAKEASLILNASGIRLHVAGPDKPGELIRL